MTLTNHKEFFLKVDTDEMTNFVETEVVSFKGGSSKEKLSFYYDALGCRTVQFTQYTEKLDFISDEEGLFVSGNGVFEIPSDLYVDNLHIPGAFLVGKRVILSNGELTTVGFSSEIELWEYIHEANFRLNVIGVTS